MARESVGVGDQLRSGDAVRGVTADLAGERNKERVKRGLALLAAVEAIEEAGRLSLTSGRTVALRCDIASGRWFADALPSIGADELTLEACLVALGSEVA